MEETPQIHEAPRNTYEDCISQQQNQIMEQTLHLIDSSRRPTNIANKISYFMIKVNLSTTFDPKQFKIISTISPEEWIKSQKQLLTKITSNKKLNQKYFPTFLSNHSKIANWYSLAIRQKSDIEPYIFKEMFLQRRQESIIQESFNNQKVKQSLLSRRKLIDKNRSQIINKPFGFMVRPSQQLKGHSFESSKEATNFSDNNIESENVSFMKPTITPLGMKKSKSKSKEKKENNYKELFKEPSSKQSPTDSVNREKQEVMGVFFNNMIELNEQQNKRKPLNLKLYKLKKKQQIDSHDLYMKTFDACNGRRYIFYDYEKHMKGLKEKNKYNFFLRNGAMEATLENYLNEQNHPTKGHQKVLSNFEEFQSFRKSEQNKEKCSLLPINLVLNERELNNYQGLKKVVCENKSSKVVFVNHQGKPITYYIKQEPKSSKGSKSCQNSKRLMKSNFGVRTTECGSEVKQHMTVENSKTIR